MKILIDMNLSPMWESVLEDAGWEVVHWSRIGDPSASDKEIMAWAKTNGHVVFTHDLNFFADIQFFNYSHQLLFGGTIWKKL